MDKNSINHMTNASRMRIITNLVLNILHEANLPLTFSQIEQQISNHVTIPNIVLSFDVREAVGHLIDRQVVAFTTDRKVKIVMRNFRKLTKMVENGQKYSQ